MQGGYSDSFIAYNDTSIMTREQLEKEQVQLPMSLVVVGVGGARFGISIFRRFHNIPQRYLCSTHSHAAHEKVKRPPPKDPVLKAYNPMGMLDSNMTTPLRIEILDEACF